MGSARCTSGWHAYTFMDVELKSFAVDDDNNATTMRQLATVMSAGRVRFDTGGPGKVYRAPSV